jgi:3D (Asp-Asp-Asp) domain-containing protein/peptidoglycan hydrolase CwlO-like protein
MCATAFQAEKGRSPTWIGPHKARRPGTALLASRPVRGRRETPLAPLVIVLAGLVVSLALPRAGGAGASERAGALRREQSTLADRSRAALLDLYSLDSRLLQARARLASLQARTAAVRDEQAQVARERAIAAAAWRSSVRTLDDRLLRIYKDGEPDAVSVLLGASSMDDAVQRLDALERSARLSRETVAQARSAQHTLARVERRLGARAAELRRLVTQARATASSLASARAERSAYLGSLERRRRLNAAEVARLAATSKRIAARSETPAAGPGAEPGPAAAAPAPPVSGTGTMLVTATGYSLGGHTSTGMPVGWGVVSVDPAVIPLGTRMSIPGYGEGVAADTGSGVQGAAIDLWFPTPAEAMAWGRRTLTIALH